MNRLLTEPRPPHDPRPGREPVRAIVALGANLGERAETLRRAAERIRRLPLVQTVVLSDISETTAERPEGPDPAAPRYANAVALVTTRLAPGVLLGMLHAIEEEFGRERRQRWGDRTLDLDLIAYGAEHSDDPRLLLPHPRAAERLFVLEPWLSIEPDAVLPGHGRVDELVRRLRQDTGAG